MKDLLAELPLDPATRETCRKLPSPARAWALAKAAFEAAQEVNFAEQRAAIKVVTADDPEPPFPCDLPKGTTRAQSMAASDLWKAWSDRNRERTDAATQPIIARYPDALKRLAKLAEQNLVEWAEVSMQAAVGPERFAAVKPAFDAYRDGDLYGDKLQQFLTICFNCPGN